jgi:hypothetical protein
MAAPRCQAGQQRWVPGEVGLPPLQESCRENCRRRRRPVSQEDQQCESRRSLQHASFDTNLQIDGFSSGSGPPFGWGNSSGTARAGNSGRNLVVDIIGARAIVWRGIEQRDKKISRATERMFRNFPPMP